MGVGGGRWGLAQMVWSTFCPRPNGQILVLGGVRKFCALFSSFWQCQKTNKTDERNRVQQKVLHCVRLTEGGGV